MGDTTELNDNPVTGAEHWAQSSILPQVLTVTYDYFLHREDSGDVISHRIDFNTSVEQSGPFSMAISRWLMTLMHTESISQCQTRAKETSWIAVTTWMNWTRSMISIAMPCERHRRQAFLCEQSVSDKDSFFTSDFIVKAVRK